MNRKTKHWEVTISHTAWVYLRCLIMDSPKLPFSIKREIFTELKVIENHIKKKPGLIGWIGYSKLIDKHIMIMYLKYGAIPYEVDNKRKVMWFKKELI